MSVVEAERRAISRALAMGGARAVARVQYGTYTVASRTRAGTSHIVSVVDGAYFCTCEAGVSGKPCWHGAAVLIAKVEHASGGRVTGPSARCATSQVRAPEVARAA